MNVIIIFLVIILIALVFAAILIHTRNIKVGGGRLKTILCIPGLGDDASSFMREKSLMDALSEYNVILFDQPADPGKNIAEYCAWIDKNITSSPDIVIGHSGGAHVANYYAHVHNCGAILIEPTPPYAFKTAREYRKHLDDPANAKYAKIAKYLWMYTENANENIFNCFAPRIIIYSHDDDDKRADQKAAEINTLAAQEIIEVKNGTHYVHTTHPEIICAAVKRMLH